MDAMMSDQTETTEGEQKISEEIKVSPKYAHKSKSPTFKALILLSILIGGSVGGYFVGWQVGQAKMSSSSSNHQTSARSMMNQVNPPDGYTMAAVFRDVGPMLVAAGAMDTKKFINLYAQQNQPLTDEQMHILTKESAVNIVITPQNAYFLLNFFWALGLVNDNKILTEGLMMAGGKSQVGSFASTGGWTIGAKPAEDLFASMKIINLTDEQQARLEEVTAAVYRPCCNNPTNFPDCNHGMAMLGLLELMASQGASTDQMFEVAKYVTAFWYPQQMLEVATVFKVVENVDFAEADSRQIVSSQFASESGLHAVHQYLASNGLLQQVPNSGGSCSVQ
jgi:hypothetical protein